MSNKTLINTLSQYLVYFTLYSVFGWCYEVFLEMVVYRWGFTNRGVLFGPYCPVYGFGALIFLLAIYPLIRERSVRERICLIPVIFLLCMFAATALELLTSYLLEYTMGSWPWQTYRDYRYHFQGRIALSPSLRFGLGGVIFLYLLQPVFEKICTLLGETKVRKIAVIFLIIFLTDCIYSFIIK